MSHPRVFTIPPGLPFLPTLADGLLDGTVTGGWPDGAELHDAVLYLPTRRAGRALASHLADRVGGTLLMPRIVALGDAGAEEFETEAGPGPPPLSLLERQLVLARLVQAWAPAREPGRDPGTSPCGAPADAVALAGDLAGLMDSLATEGVPWGALAEAVETEFSAYFASTLEFVRIAHESWPAILADRGASDPVRRRHEALLAEAERLGGERGPVVAAGSTGSIPGTARLLGIVSRLPHGAVVLPGLDTELDGRAWDAIGGEGRAGAPPEPLWGHPQMMLRRLVHGSLGLDRDAIGALGPALAGPAVARRRLVSHAMRPSELTHDWAEIPTETRLAIAREGCEGLVLVEAADEREEALAVAIALRETLAEPGRTAALATPDRALARRVAAELARWGIVAEDSAGTPLPDTPAGRLARLAADAAAADFAPVAIRALLAHPAVTLGQPRADVEAASAALEIAALRGPLPRPGLGGLAKALDYARAHRGRRDPLPRQDLTDRDWDAAADLLRRLEDAFAGFTPGEAPGQVDLVALAAPHAATLAALTAPGPDSAGDSRDALALDAFLDELSLMPTGRRLSGEFRDYPGVFAVLSRDRSVAPDPASTHRRVKILGLLEARLLDVDRVVLGGLDEGIWPPTADSDAFLNRPMRVTLGLSPAERRIGQTAHDLAQALGTRDAVLTRARKRDGKPTVPSRFLERLRSFAGKPCWDGLRARGECYLALGRVLDAPRPVARIARPAPRPGGARFPRSLSVTEIETLIRDPYAIFARHVLRLTPLDPMGAMPSVAERGSILHDVLASFAASHPGALLPDAETELLQRGIDAFGHLAETYPELYALWWPDFQRLVPSLIAWETARRDAFPSRILERSGLHEIPLPDGSFTLRGRADRIELDGAGRAAIVDFKSGQPPGHKEVAAGFSPQLTLEAAMLLRGGFKDAPPVREVPSLLYVKLGGRKRLFERDIKPPAGRPLAEVIEAHLDGLGELVRRYVLEDEGYASRPFAKYVLRHSAYDHLARVKEWSIAGADQDAVP